jgi:hypothetical protein
LYIYRAANINFKFSRFSAPSCIRSRGKRTIQGIETPSIPRHTLLPLFDLATSDYCLFSNLKGRKFSSTEEATLAADGWFAA